MLKTEDQYRQEIVEVARLIYQREWVAANDGNLSIRLDENTLLCTPTNVSKGLVKAEDLILCDMQGKRICGERNCTSEIAMHLTIYALRPDVNAVVHAHPPVATGFASAGRALNLALLPEVVIGLGSVPLCAYGLPGTPALTAGMLEYIPKYDALLMANHGSVAYGADLYAAFFKMETVEHFARITLVAELAGGAKPLPRVEVAKLFDSRARYGVKSGAPPQPGNPLTAEDMKREERFEFTRDELLSLLEETLRARSVR